MTQFVQVPRRYLLLAGGIVAATVVAVILTADGGTGDLHGQAVFARSTGREIELFKLDVRSGQVQQISEAPGTSTSPDWSSRGDDIAFVRRGGVPYNVWVMSGPGGPSRQVTSGTAIDGHPTWSPDGRRLAFSSNRAEGSSQFDVYVLDLDGGDLRVIARGQAPTWHPSGRELAFNRDGDLYSIDLRTGREQQLTSAAGFDDGPVWSPDGAALAFTRSQGEDRWLYVLGPDGETRLTGGAVHDSHVDWFPDGAALIFSRREGQHTHLHVLNLTSGTVRQITDGPYSDLAPSVRP